MTAKLDVSHGHYLSYLRDGCRCPTCTEGWRIHCAAQKEQRIAKGLARGDRRHGTENGYANWGCRCRRCTKAHNSGKARRRKGTS